MPSTLLVRNAVANVLLLGLSTGMPQGELAAIRWANVHPNFIHTDSKSMVDFTRDVPLSRQAKRVVEKMRGYDPTSMFNINAGSIDTHFRNAKTRANLDGFTFHDSRHTAAT
jgi:integrase